MRQSPRQLPFRLGTTSYIIPDDILPNVCYLVDKVDDIELVLFEVDDGPNNLPSAEVVSELARLAKIHQLTYTVHLPLDLKLASGGAEQSVSLQKARRVIDCTCELNPWAYVLHLDARQVKDQPSSAVMSRWQEQSAQALEIVAGWTGSMPRLAVENLEGYPPDTNLPVLERSGASACLDIGHLWLDGHNPLEHLIKMLPVTRVIHIHGIKERDHRSLAAMPADKLDAIFSYLLAQDYNGVLTLEVFSEADFISSLAAIDDSLGRIGF
jgi:sugar phosphate isomerase/epimerase